METTQAVDKYDAMERGITWAKEKGLSKPADIAVAIMVELRKAGFGIVCQPRRKEAN